MRNPRAPLTGLILSALLVACGGGPTPQPGPAPRAYAFTASAAVTPTVPALPAREAGGAARPVAAVRGTVTTEFVLDEVLLSGGTPEQAQALAQKYGGSVVQTVVPDAALKGVPTLYTLKLDLSGVDAGNIAADWAKDKAAGAGGSFEVSSPDVLKLLRVIYTERQAGVKLELNYVDTPSSFFDGSAEFGGEDAFSWADFYDGGVVKVGVQRAWKALEHAGKLGNRVKVAVIDRGFNWAGLDDFPTLVTTDKDLPRPNQKEKDKPWHGSMVSLALAGRADNGHGAAGPGAPVVDLIALEYGSADGVIADLNTAYKAGARIINMSFSGKVEAGFWGYPDTMENMESLTNALWASGVLMFASAGNDGANIDAMSGDHEAVWHWPCENESVICVGGLNQGTVARADGSNYGTGAGNTVDLYAPYEVRIGAYAPGMADGITTVPGTSFSSPFAAGIAALVWAANPQLKNTQVYDLLLKYVNKGQGGGLPVVTADGPVHEALLLSGQNSAPRVSIVTPAQSPVATTSQGGLVPFTASTFDAEDYDTPVVTWRVDGGAVIATGLTAVVPIGTVGLHTVTATATDKGGQSAQASVKVQVINAAPKVSITGPAGGTHVRVGQPLQVTAVVTDDAPVNDSACVWTSAVAGEGPWTGCQTTVTFKYATPQPLTVTYTDAQGLKASAALNVYSDKLPAAGPPEVLLQMQSHDVSQPNAIITWSFADPGGPGLTDLSGYTLKWELQLDGVRKTFSPVNFLGRQGEKLIEPGTVFTLPTCYFTNKTFTVFLTITDPEGLSGTGSLPYTWDPGCIH